LICFFFFFRASNRAPRARRNSHFNNPADGKSQPCAACLPVGRELRSQDGFFSFPRIFSRWSFAVSVENTLAAALNFASDTFQE
jgi:hypothetical protein